MGFASGINSQNTMRLGRGFGGDEDSIEEKAQFRKVSPRDVAKQLLKHCNVVRKKNFNVSPRFKEMNQQVFGNNS